MFTEVEGVWGDPKSKYQRKTSFLKRSRLDLCNKKDLKTFHQKLAKFWPEKKNPGFFSPTVNTGQEIFKARPRQHAILCISFLVREVEISTLWYPFGAYFFLYKPKP